MEILRTSIIQALLGTFGNLRFHVSKTGKNNCRLQHTQKNQTFLRQRKQWRLVSFILGRKWQKLSAQEKKVWIERSKKYPGCSGYNIFIASAYKLLKDKNKNYLRKHNIPYPHDLRLIRRNLTHTAQAIQRRKKYKHNLQDVQTTYQHLHNLPIKLSNRLIIPKITNYKELTEAFQLRLIKRKSGNEHNTYQTLTEEEYKQFLLQAKRTRKESIT